MTHAAQRDLEISQACLPAGLLDFVCSVTGHSSAEFAELPGQLRKLELWVLRQVSSSQLGQRMLNWLSESTGPLGQHVFRRIHAEAVKRGTTVEEPIGHALTIDHSFEHELDQTDRRRRRRHGVFYTPPEVARFIVARADKMLRDLFHHDLGLVDAATSVTTKDELLAFDPAAGTGVFLLELIDAMHASVDEDEWNDFVVRYLLPGIGGCELMPLPHLMSQWNLAVKLAQTGFDFATPARMQIFLGDTLAGPDALSSRGSGKAFADEVEQTRAAVYNNCLVVLGNPPFSALSRNEGKWIDGLMRGRSSSSESGANYYEVEGQPLGERKTWLHDDYVKFIRYGQWRIERRGRGILAFITNHGYLDNATFRGMRWQLLQAFDRIAIVDLHGNLKSREQSPDGEKDENVFEIEQGVAVGLFTRTGQEANECRVEHTDVWGTRQQKLSRLSLKDGRQNEEAVRFQSLEPHSPHFFFVPRNHSLDDEYRCGFRLPEIMPVNTTAVVTARDSFVIAFSRDELLHRIAQFRDLSISDDEIRARYFGNTRSTRYPPGDTRGWKLTKARETLAKLDDWQSFARPCCYRVFDRRWIYWHQAMIDWPRREVMRHLMNEENIAIVTRRQMLPSQPCGYFWATNDITIDGVIRSDNRGSESVFPLYLSDVPADDSSSSQRNANFSPQFITAIELATELKWQPHGPVNLHQTFVAEDLGAYIYAQFHSTEYRERYASQLHVDFPRVFLPGDATLFLKLKSLGRKLLKCHLTPLSTTNDDDGSARLERGFPKYRGGDVWLNQRQSIVNVDGATWEYRIGGHQVCRKWLKDRCGRRLTAGEVSHAKSIVERLREMRDLTRQIDAAIEAEGGWISSFRVDTAHAD